MDSIFHLRVFEIHFCIMYLNRILHNLKYFENTFVRKVTLNTKVNYN